MIERIIIANDTGHTTNPGCQSVRRAIDFLAAEAGMSIVGSLPLGFWAEPFRDLAPPSRACVVIDEDRFPSGAAQAPPLDLAAWERVRADLAANDREFLARTDEADFLLVNGEGSIHHNFPRALGLAALIVTAAERGLRVALVNSTIQAMDPGLLRRVLPRLWACHVREPASLCEVEARAPGAFCAPDLAVAAIDRLPAPSRQRGSGKECLVSTGVLSHPKTLRRVLEIVEGIGFRPTYFSIGDGGETDVAAGICAQRGVRHLQAKDYSLEGLAGLLAQFDIAVCGRHHLNLFLMRAGVPFVPIPSNTWKVEATLSYLGYPLAPIERLGDLAGAFERASRERDILTGAGIASFERASSALEGITGRIFRY
jgi:hypothetical protein